jgi:AAA domain
VEEAVLDEYRLNRGQKLAFRHIVRYGPVGLLQGPPGTGKTHFIAALVHWLVTRAGAQKILIASQSHEAVNNAIEKLVDLFKGLKRRPNLLRIGSKGITQKIRPFHTTSSRDGYKVRFDNAFKHRITSLGAAVGLRREFVADAVEIERLIGRPVDRILTLTGVANSAEGLAPEDRRRCDSSLRSAVNAFVSGGRKLTGRELDVARATEELDDAFDGLLERHEGTSPSDVAKVRGLISLSLEWSDALGTSQRNFEEFLAKTRTIVTATCVGAGQTRIRIDARAYDWVIVDEAARCTSGELAVPIQVGRRVLRWATICSYGR